MNLSNKIHEVNIETTNVSPVVLRIPARNALSSAASIPRWMRVPNIARIEMYRKPVLGLVYASWVVFTQEVLLVVSEQKWLSSPSGRRPHWTGPDSTWLCLYNLGSPCQTVHLIHHCFEAILYLQAGSSPDFTSTCI